MKRVVYSTKPLDKPTVFSPTLSWTSPLIPTNGQGIRNIYTCAGTYVIR